MKSSRMKKILAVILCLTLGFSTNMMTMAESTNSPAVQTVQEEQQTDASATTDGVEVLAETDQTVTGTPTPTATPEPETTPEVTTTPTPEATPEATATPTPETTPEATATPTPETTPEATATPTPEVTTLPTVEPTQTPDSDANTDLAEEINETDEISIQTVLDGTTITMSGPKESFPDGSDYQISAARLNENEEKAVSEALEKKAIESKINISSYQAFDIKLMVDGVESQPVGDVHVTFEGSEIAETVGDTENVDVYHVDTNTEEVNDIQNEKTENDQIVMKTDHFSTYVIVNNNPAEITVTVNHYLSDQKDETQKQKLYTSAEFKVQGKTDNDTYKLENFTKDSMDESGAAIYEVDSIFQVLGDQEEEITNQFDDNEDGVKIYTASTDVELNIYYTAKSGQYTNGVSFFDYENGSGESNDFRSINSPKNYDVQTGQSRIGTIGIKESALLTVSDGTLTHTFNVNEYKRSYNDLEYTHEGRSDGYGASSGSVRDGHSWPIITGIITNLSGTKYETVNFNEKLSEPGFFTAETKTGKTLYNNYQLNFNRVGNRYTLYSVYNRTTGETPYTNNKNGSDFFPLNEVGSGTGNNEYFGMRYDFYFTLDDYMGEMNYTFTGDDDLWVFMDGELILDLGGIHGAYPAGGVEDYTNAAEIWPNSVDIWEVLLGKADYTDTDKEAYLNIGDNAEKKHQITVLYMERGGGSSNCSMEFVMPDITGSDPIITTDPKAVLTFSKVDADDGDALSGAIFGVYTSDGNTKVDTVTVEDNDDGTYTISNLKEGEYILKEETAPQGYINSGKTWKIKVTVEGETATATLYDGETQITQIENTSIENALDISKDVKSISDDGRNFQVTLTADSLATYTESGSSKAINVVLVLDKSGSMNYYGGYELTNEYDGELKQDITYYFELNNEVYRLQYSSNWFGGGRWKYSKFTYTNYNWNETGYGINWSGSWDYNTNMNVQLYTEFTHFNRFSVMKKAATEFVNKLASKSKDSTVGIVTFSSNAVQELSLTNVTTGQSTILNKISALQNPSGGTRPSLGLSEAAEMLESLSEKQVILLSDGDPDGEYESAGINQATEMRSQGIMIHTIGFMTTTSTEQYLTKVAGNANNFHSADDIDSLINSFNLILDDITQGTVIEDAIVYDEIDSRFIVVDASGNPITTVVSNGKTGTVVEANGKTYIIWEDQDIGPRDDETGESGWSVSFYLKAKDDFLGGNMIPTNGEAYVQVGTEKKHFNKPTVNVQPLELSIDNKSVTLFKGEQIKPDDYLTELNQTISIGEETLNLSLTPDQLVELKTNESLSVPYSYTGTNDQVGLLVYTFKTTSTDTAEHVANEVSDPESEAVETYSISVQYVPSSLEERKEQSNLEGYEEPNTNPKFDSFDNPEYSSKEAVTGTYSVYVVAGKVTVKKTIDASDYKDYQGDPIFTFKLTRTYQDASGTEQTEAWYESVRFQAQDITTGTKTVVFDELPYGKYTVEEVNGGSLVFKQTGNATYTKDETNGCDIDNQSFNIGIRASDEDKEYINKRNGIAEITNKAITETDVDSDIVVNRFVVDENGNVVIQPDKLQGDSEAEIN